MSATNDEAKLRELAEASAAKLKAGMDQPVPPSEAAQAALEARLASDEAREEKEQTGEDLDFDLVSFITDGIITKTAIKLREDLYADMHSLTAMERGYAERMVREKFGNLPMDNFYFSSLETALLAMSITRLNNMKFPVPDRDGDAKTFEENYKRKVELMNNLLKSSADFVRALSLIYQNLNLVDMLKEPKEVIEKKS